MKSKVKEIEEAVPVDGEPFDSAPAAAEEAEDVETANRGNGDGASEESLDSVPAATAAVEDEAPPSGQGPSTDSAPAVAEEAEDVETANRRTGDGASVEPIGSVSAAAEEIDLEKELLGDKSEKDSGDSVDKFPPEKMDEVLKLAADGVTSVEIARQVGLEPGEVELIVNLRGKAQSE